MNLKRVLSLGTLAAVLLSGATSLAASGSSTLWWPASGGGMFQTSTTFADVNTIVNGWGPGSQTASTTAPSTTGNALVTASGSFVLLASGTLPQPPTTGVAVYRFKFQNTSGTWTFGPEHKFYATPTEFTKKVEFSDFLQVLGGSTIFLQVRTDSTSTQVIMEPERNQWEISAIGTFGGNSTIWTGTSNTTSTSYVNVSQLVFPTSVPAKIAMPETRTTIVNAAFAFNVTAPSDLTAFQPGYGFFRFKFFDSNTSTWTFGPEHMFFSSTGKNEYVTITDQLPVTGGSDVFLQFRSMTTTQRLAISSTSQVALAVAGVAKASTKLWGPPSPDFTTSTPAGFSTPNAGAGPGGNLSITPPTTGTGLVMVTGGLSVTPQDEFVLVRLRYFNSALGSFQVGVTHKIFCRDLTNYKVMFSEVLSNISSTQPISIEVKPDIANVTIDANDEWSLSVAQ